MSFNKSIVGKRQRNRLRRMGKTYEEEQIRKREQKRRNAKKVKR